MYAIRTYNHGIFPERKYSPLKKINGLNKQCISGLTQNESLEHLWDQISWRNMGENFAMVIHTHGCIYNHGIF